MTLFTGFPGLVSNCSMGTKLQPPIFGLWCYSGSYFGPDCYSTRHRICTLGWVATSGTIIKKQFPVQLVKEFQLGFSEVNRVWAEFELSFSWVTAEDRNLLRRKLRYWEFNWYDLLDFTALNFLFLMQTPLFTIISYILRLDMFKLRSY